MSESESNSGADDLDNREELLKQLQRSGEQFMNMFGSQAFPQTSKKRKRKCKSPAVVHRPIEESLSSGNTESMEEENGEWGGISENLASTSVIVVEHTGANSRKAGQEYETKESDRKAFMSSSISKMTSKSQPSKIARKQESELEKEERSNLENDTLLQRMIHTQLLSGSLDPDLDLTNAKRQKALAGRVEEVAGSSKIGKGEDRVRKAEHNRASKHIRDGIQKKKAKLFAAKVEESKDLGNYHPSLKKALSLPEETPRAPKRVRGLSLGVGKFKGGVLHLSRDEIQSVSGKSRGNHAGGKRKR